MSKVAIYALCEFPDLKSVRYVGQSIDPTKRVRQHTLWHNEASRWAKMVVENGGAIGCVVIEWVAVEVADLAERFWIVRLRSEGHRLENYKHVHFHRRQAPRVEYSPDAPFTPGERAPIETIPTRLSSSWNTHTMIANRAWAMEIEQAAARLRNAKSYSTWEEKTERLILMQDPHLAK